MSWRRHESVVPYGQTEEVGSLKSIAYLAMAEFEGLWSVARCPLGRPLLRNESSDRSPTAFLQSKTLDQPNTPTPTLAEQDASSPKMSEGKSGARRGRRSRRLSASRAARAAAGGRGGLASAPGALCCCGCRLRQSFCSGGRRRGGRRGPAAIAAWMEHVLPRGPRLCESVWL